MEINQRFCGIKLAICGLMLAIAGCGGGDFNTPLYPVEGEVFFKGKPATGCIVSFHPASAGSENAGHACMGTVDAAGKFRLTTREPFDGIAVGNYSISFSWPGAGTSMDPAGDSAPDRLPKKYQFAESSGFTASITSSTSTLPRFDLK